jgi:hypothetical protein
MLQITEASGLLLGQASCDWMKLIRKLRWIGMEDEAQRLQQAVSTVAPDQRGSVLAEPFSTD